MRAPLSVTRLDVCTFVVDIDGARAIFDPWLHDPARIWPWWTAHHRDAPVWTELPAVDLLLVSQRSDDHCDLRAIGGLTRATPVVATASAARRLRPLGFDVRAMAWGDRVERGGFVITALPAGHAGVPDQNGYRLERSGRTVLFLADTARLPALVQALDARRDVPDAVLVSANGFRVLRRRINMNPEEAAELVAHTRTPHVVPMRHLAREEARGFVGRLLSDWITPEEAATRFAAALQRAAAPAAVHVLDRGQTWTATVG